MDNITIQANGLNQDQVRILAICGKSGIEQAIAEGKLPADHPTVIEILDRRIRWEDPKNWSIGDWFIGSWINGQFRSGKVYIRRETTPDNKVQFRVVQWNGQWCDTLDINKAQAHLKADRGLSGQINWCDQTSSRDATRMLNRALSN